MAHRAVVLALMGVTMAGAFETGSSQLAWNTIHGTGNYVVQAPKPAAIISADGRVEIDWDVANEIVANPSNHDGTTLAIARLMVAIRDGKWTPR